MKLNQVQYDDGELITEHMPSDGILVIEANLQGVFDLAPHTQRFERAFPITYKAFLKRILEGSVIVGGVLWFTEDNYRIAIIVTAERIFGKYKDDNELMEIYTEEAIDNLLKGAENEVLLMGLVNRCVNATGNVISYLNKKLTTQLVYMYRR